MSKHLVVKVLWLFVMLCCTDGDSAELQPVEGVSRTPVESSRDDAFRCNWVKEFSLVLQQEGRWWMLSCNKFHSFIPFDIIWFSSFSNILVL